MASPHTANPANDRSSTAKGDEWARRARLLAVLIVATLFVNILLVPGFFLPRPQFGMLAVLTLSTLFTIGAGILNRKSRAQDASRVYLFGHVLAATLGMFLLPYGAFAWGCSLYGRFVLAVLCSGFLLGRKAPFSYAAASILIILAHVVLRSGEAVPSVFYPAATLSLFPTMTMLLSALISGAGAGSVEDALRRAYRVENVEQLYRETDRQRMLAENLRVLAARLADELDQETLLRQVAEEVVTLGYLGCSVWLTETDAEGMRAFVRHTTTFETVYDPVLLRVGESRFDISAALRGEIVRIVNPAQRAEYSDAERTRFIHLGIEDCVMLPVRYRGEVLGGLVVCASEKAHGLGEPNADPFPPAALDFLNTLADHAALALGNALLHREQREAHAALEAEHNAVIAQAEQLAGMNAQLRAVQTELEAQYHALEEANRQLSARATTDGMTGLANHRAFQEELARQISRAARSNSPLTLLLMDVDSFKQYNDSFGHPAGDEVLRGVATLLRKEVREGDFPARYGGEEFAVILPETDSVTARQIAERIRAAVEGCAFAHRKVTVSVGVSQYITEEPSGSMIERADVALYEAKSAGRNQVIYIPVHLREVEAESGEEASVPLWEENPDHAEAAGLTLTTLSDTEERMQAASMVISALPPVLLGGLEGLLQEPVGLVLSAMLDALDRRGMEPSGHSERVARYALRLALTLNELYDAQRDARPLLPRLTNGDLIALAYGSLLHDIGKVGITDAILCKTGKLTEDEWRQIRRHPLAGAEMLMENGVLVRALPVVRYHHERWDGTGYPQGLAGEAIPLVARIFAVCDTFDSLTTERVYRTRLDFTAACAEIALGARSQFDPDVVTAFMMIPESDWTALGKTAYTAAAPLELPQAA